MKTPAGCLPLGLLSIPLVSNNLDLSVIVIVHNVTVQVWEVLWSIAHMPVFKSMQVEMNVHSQNDVNHVGLLVTLSKNPVLIHHYKHIHKGL